MAPTVLIAAPAHLPALQAQDDLSGALAFSDRDALRALEVITDQRPRVVAIDHLFAATSRGSALIDRIKADPALTACEVRIVVSERSGNVDDGGPLRPAIVRPEPASAPPLALDDIGTRRAQRFAIVEGLEVLIDGNIAMLRDLSLAGAMVTSLAILRPNQRVRLSLPDLQRPLRVNGMVAWARFELFNGAPRYRAGIEFVDADVHAVRRFIDAHAAEKFTEALEKR